MTILEQDREQTFFETISLGSVLIGLLSFLIVVGLFAAAGRLFMGLGASTALTDSYAWGIWIGFDFLLIALSGVGFTMAGLVHVFRREKYHAAVRPAVLAGLMGYSAVLMILLIDLGRFDRFYHFLIFWNPHSPLFEICWCVLLYTLVLVIEVSPVVFERLKWERPNRWVARAMLPVAIIGVTLSSLHQSTLGTLYLNMPHRVHALWYTPFLPLLFFVSSVMAGLALAIYAYAGMAWARGQQPRRDIVDGLARILGWVALSYSALKCTEIVVAGELPALLAFDRESILMWVELGLGAVLPAVLILLPSLRSRKWSPFVGAALVLLGVSLNRFNMTLFAQSPVSGIGSYSPHIIEWLTTLGIIAGAVLLWYLGVRLLITLEGDEEDEAGHPSSGANVVVSDSATAT
jgi:Ni/Fe-hydrogenase subunit HybB-like protein